jgi:hypothetical protein
MPEWLLAALAAAGMSALANAFVGMRMLGKTEQVVSRLDIDVKDLQRDKLDRDLHESAYKRIEDRILHVDEKHVEGRKNLEHKINGVSQRVTLMEQKR